MTFRVLQRAGALLALALIVPACEFSGFYVPFPPVTVNATLGGTQVAPAVTTVSTGTASLVVDGLQTSIDYSVTYAGAGIITAVEIRLGAAGTNGPKIFTLATAPFTNPLTGTLNSTNLTAQPSLGVVTISDAIDRILNGNAHVLISTIGNPAGEIRGQLGSAVVTSVKLTGAQEVSPVATTATGSATLLLNAAQTQIGVTLNVSGLTGITAAHLHFGAAGVGAGPIIFNLSAIPFASPLTMTLSSTDFLAGGGLVTFSDAINALLSGLLYVNVHSTGNPGGEIRGQIGPAQMSAALSAASVVPTNSSTATGAATVILNGTQTAINVTVTHTVASPTAALLHADVPLSNGPQIFDAGAIAGSAASPAAAALQAVHLIPAPAKAVLVFADAIDALLTGRTYVDVASAGFPAGEIRGQILP
jgi:hypothetical protein